ncbi:MAG: AsmA family protein [Elusimicrobiaceae bacterium]|jgi:hypothetical protein|nr:AsmA family protein [Elusimicrobiaceae bacterium]MBT3955268.1 AsmA family protein [Elusimicrobiaceae bacterium]MBT4007810.1 AsmA family protein [Elusimicrobiaceae bacterium]MBT4403276.1 AsmA family protein [Elusimicrobiaceae bacterium]MBT4440423.1 AsmA family protein [Elusimicrobiaceae bacterium]
MKKHRSKIVLIIRICMTIALVSVILASIGYFSLLKYLNNKNLTANFANFLQEKFDKPVVVSSLEFHFPNEILVHDVQIIDYGPDHYDQLLAVDNLMVRYNMFKLIGKKFVIKSMYFNKPKIKVIRDKDGNLNIPTLSIKQRESIADEADKQEFKFDISVDNIGINDGQLVYKDLKNNISHAIYSVNTSFNNLDFIEDTEVSFGFISRNKWGEKIIESQILGDGKINFANLDWEKAKIKDTSIIIKFFKEPITALVNVENLRNPRISFQGNIPAVNYTDVSIFFDSPFDFAFPPAEIYFDATLKQEKYLALKDMVVNMEDVSFGMYAEYNMSEKLLDMQFETNKFNFANKNNWFPGLKGLELEGVGDINGTLKISETKKIEEAVNIKLKDIKGKLRGFTISKFSGIVDIMDGFKKVTAQLKDLNFDIGGQSFTKLHGQFELGHNKMFVNLPSGLFNGKDMKLSFYATNLNDLDKRHVNMAADFETFELLEIFDTVGDFGKGVNPKYPNIPKKPMPHEGKLSWLRNFRAKLPKFIPNIKGVVSARQFITPSISGEDFNLEVDFQNLKPGMDKLSGTFDAQISNGIIYKLEEFAANDSAYNVAFAPFIMMHKLEKMGSFEVGTILKNVPYDRIVLSTNFNNGAMRINNFLIESIKIPSTVSGWVDWYGENIDVNVWTRFTSSSSAGAIAESLTDETGKPAIAFRSKGNMYKGIRTELVSSKSVRTQIDKATEKGIRTDFSTSEKFKKGGYNVKKK